MSNINNLFFLTFTLILGILLRNIYFQRLWMMVQQLPNAENLILLTLGGFFGCLTIAIAGFALIVRLTEENV